MRKREKERLLLRIISYEKGAVYDNYEDGSTAIFDMVKCEILDGRQSDTLLEILVEQTSNDVAIWNRLGQDLVALVDSNILDESDLIFSGAFEIVV